MATPDNGGEAVVNPTASEDAVIAKTPSKPEKSSMEQSQPPMTAAEEAWDLAKTVLVAVAIALVLRIVVFQPFNIPSGSMKPNLLVGDFLVVSKPTFGYSKASLVYPLTRMPIDGRIFAGSPERGDIVVFKNKKDGNKDYIKRVIGMPGDQIQMLGGHLYINGSAVQKEFVEVAEDVCGGGDAPTYKETLDNGVSYLVQECSGDDGELDTTAVYHVPAGHYFMMGDNRDQSQDSRVVSAVGYIPLDAVVGRAERFFFSVDGAKTKFWEVWKWPFAIRYGRILDKVE
ncbi:signal peptidase I [Hyphococcus lacteus]|uniref:Signal peptidase I n=1 Tax=Hyphococcus lacteus TaxID=3143536 RepID=A0ABV3Z6N0_9PROT